MIKLKGRVMAMLREAEDGCETWRDGKRWKKINHSIVVGNEPTCAQVEQGSKQDSSGPMQLGLATLGQVGT